MLQSAERDFCLKFLEKFKTIAEENGVIVAPVAGGRQMVSTDYGMGHFYFSIPTPKKTGTCSAFPATLQS